MDLILAIVKTNPQLFGALLLPILRATVDALEKNPNLLEEIIKKVAEAMKND